MDKEGSGDGEKRQRGGVSGIKRGKGGVGASVGGYSGEQKREEKRWK